MDSNSFTGPLPKELGCMESLEELDLANNPGLTGPIPPEVMPLE